MINNVQRTFTTLYKPIFVKNNPLQEFPKAPSILPYEQINLLQPILPSVMLVNTWKYKAKVKKRCKGCYFLYKEGVLHNLCHLKPKHKQILFHPKDKNTWILSGVSTNKSREW